MCKILEITDYDEIFSIYSNLSDLAEVSFFANYEDTLAIIDELLKIEGTSVDVDIFNGDYEYGDWFVISIMDDGCIVYNKEEYGFYPILYKIDNDSDANIDSRDEYIVHFV